MTARVVVFVDYENMHRCARNEFGVQNGHFWPWQLGETLVNNRNANPSLAQCELVQVRIYRGLPDSRLQPRANAANQAQHAAWVKTTPRLGGLHVLSRPLRYPPNWPNDSGSPQEKGIDVALAVDLVHLAYKGDFDIAIVCSHDTDISPALDVAASVTAVPVRIEVAAWGRKRRISFTNRPNQPWCHHLDRPTFDQVSDPTVYP
jgi:uncharacterized LabA/DUF88 family protein